MAVTITRGRNLPRLKELTLVSGAAADTQDVACRGFNSCDIKVEAIAGGGTIDLRRYIGTQSGESTLESLLTDTGGTISAALSGGDEPRTVSLAGAAKIQVKGTDTTSYTVRLTLR